MSIDQVTRQPPAQRSFRRSSRARRRALAVAVAFLAVLGTARTAVAAPVGSAAITQAGTTQTISWVGCKDGYQCATVRVPLDYDQPAGVQISLAVSRLPATDPAHRRGSLFVNPGGPGGSAYRSGSAFPAAVRQRFDIIGMDPRGIGASTPLRCFTDAEQAGAATHPTEFPATTADRVEWKRVDEVFAAGCAAHAGRIIDHMATADVARDLDLLRRLVGDQRLNYVGASYGSILGQTYANMFPDRVGAVVIDGVLDPVAWSTGQARQAWTIPFTDRIGSAAAVNWRSVSSSRCVTRPDRHAPSPAIPGAGSTHWPPRCAPRRSPTRASPAQCWTIRR